MDFLSPRRVDLATILKNNGLTPEIQRHTSRVYSCLAAMIFIASLGTYTSVIANITNSLLQTIPLFGLLIWLGYTRGKVTNARLAALMAVGFLKGLAIGPLVRVALDIDPRIVVTAFVGSSAIFVSFSLAALLAKRREFLYLGGVLGSAVTLLFFGSLLNMFMRSQFLFTAELYIGLFVFCGYVIFDTQIMLESAIQGSRDYIWHALELFIDFAAIFVRILVILLRNAERKDERERRSARK